MLSELMFQMANSFMNVSANAPLLAEGDEPTQWGWVNDVCDAINLIIYPLLVLIGTAGIIYAIVLGVKLARAESADEQQEGKKRIINFIIGLVSIIALILLMKLFVTYLPAWIQVDDSISDQINPSGGNGN